jgi:hypothetical protein
VSGIGRDLEFKRFAESLKVGVDQDGCYKQLLHGILSGNALIVAASSRPRAATVRLAENAGNHDGEGATYAYDG